MSVVSGAARRRWATVLAGVLLLGAVPPALAALPADEPAAQESAEALLERVRGSESVAHEGLAEVRGQFGLPSLPRLDDVARLLDGTTRTRVWWASPRRWRAATLTPTSERATAQTRVGPAVWDYDASTTTFLLGDPALRLPRSDDLLPPQAVRRLLNGLGPDDRVERIAARRVAGIDAAGVRIRPADPRSSVADVDVYVEPATGLPLQLELHAAGRAQPVLSSSFLDVELETPSEAETAAATPRGGRVRTSSTPDLASTVDRYAPFVLPNALAGLRSSEAPRGIRGAETYGAAVYGTGLTRFVVLPLPGDVAAEAIQRARQIALPLEVEDGEAIPLHRPLLSVVLARGEDNYHAYLLAGTVQPEVLQTAVQELFADPPEAR